MILLIRHCQLQLVLLRVVLHNHEAVRFGPPRQSLFRNLPNYCLHSLKWSTNLNYSFFQFIKFHEQFFSLENTPYLLNSIGNNILKARVDWWWGFLFHFNIFKFFWVSLRLLLTSGRTGRMEGRLWRYQHPLWRPRTRLPPFSRRRCWRRSLQGRNWFCPFGVAAGADWFSDLESSFFRNERFFLGSVDPGRFLNRWLREIRVLLSH